MNEKQILTHSSISTFKKCRRRYFWEYECGIRGKIDGKALRIGSTGHTALEFFKRDGNLEKALETIDWYYALLTDLSDDEIKYEKKTVACLVAGYVWRWANAPLEIIATEQSFNVPLFNPSTKSSSLIFDIAGKIDGIVRLQDQRLAVQEHKFLSEQIDDDSDLWRRLQIDQQITVYVMVARRIGHNVDTVLYDIIRKPTIKPTPVPVLDDNGMKIVLDKDGNRPMTARGQFYQTGNAEKGLVLQQREMTADEWGKKLLDDIGERPDFYYVRKEVPRLDDEIIEFQYELWDIQKTIRAAQNEQRWFKTVSSDTCDYCSFRALCLSKYNPSDPLLEGFIKIDDVHPELKSDSF